MVANIKKIFHLVKGNSLYSNSIYLMLSTVVNSLFGFIFWIICSKLYTVTQIGIATTLISTTLLIANFSLVGLNNTLIRFINKSTRKNEDFNTSNTVVIIVSLGAALLFILVSDFFIPKLSFIHSGLPFVLLFVFSVILTSLNLVNDAVFIAFRSTGYLLLKSFAMSFTKILSPIFVITLGAYGIFISSIIPVIFSIIIGTYYVYKVFEFSFNPQINILFIRRSIKFSLSNYLSGFLNSLPSYALPLLISAGIGVEFSGYYYIDMMIAMLLYMIPLSVSQSFFAESSLAEHQIYYLLKRSLAISSFFVLPAMLFLIIAGSYILNIFGTGFKVHGLTYLYYLVLSAPFIMINSLCTTVLNILNTFNYLISINIIGVVLIMSLSYLLRSWYLPGVGIAWIVGQLAMSFLFLAFLYYNRKSHNETKQD